MNLKINKDLLASQDHGRAQLFRQKEQMLVDQLKSMQKEIERHQADALI